MNEKPIPFPLPENHPLKKVSRVKPLKLFAREVIETVSTVRGIKREEILGRRRLAQIAMARQIAMYVIREHRQEGWNQIGKIFDRDHGTVMHAVKSVRAAMETEPAERESVTAILRKLDLPTPTT